MVVSICFRFIEVRVRAMPATLHFISPFVFCVPDSVLIAFICPVSSNVTPLLQRKKLRFTINLHILNSEVIIQIQAELAL